MGDVCMYSAERVLKGGGGGGGGGGDDDDDACLGLVCVI